MPLPTNFKGSDAEKGEPIPGGTYRCSLKKIEAFDPDEARAAGKNTTAEHPSLRADWVVQDEGEYFGRHIFDNLILTAGKNFMLRRFLDAIAWPDDKDIISDGVFVAASDMAEAECNLVVEIDPAKTIEGVTYEARNRVKAYITVFG